MDDKTVGYFQDEKQVDNQNEFGGSIGGPIVRDRLFFFGSISPRNDGRPTSTTSTTAPRPERDDLAPAGVRQAELRHAALQSPTGRAVDADDSGRHAAGLQRGGTNSYLVPRRCSSNGNPRLRDEPANTSGNVDIDLTNSAFLSFRGGYFYDSYKDTGIPKRRRRYTYQTPTLRCRACRRRCRAETRSTLRAFRSPTSTRRSSSTFNADYNHAFTGAGVHTLKGGYGFQRTTNDIDSFYPAATCTCSGTARSRSPANSGRGHVRLLRGERSANHARAGSNIHSLYVQDQWTIGNRLTLNLGVRTENEKDPDVPAGHPEVRVPVRLRRQARAAARRGLRRVGRRSGEGVRELGPLLRLDEIRAAARLVRRRHLVHLLPRLDTLDIGSLNLTTCRDGTSGSAGRLPRPPRAIVPGRSIRHRADEAGQLQRRRRVPAREQQRRHGASTTSTTTCSRRSRTWASSIVNGDSVYSDRQPRQGPGGHPVTRRTTAAGQPIPTAEAGLRRARARLERRFSDNWFVSANYTLSRLYGNYSGLASSTRSARRRPA